MTLEKSMIFIANVSYLKSNSFPSVNFEFFPSKDFTENFPARAAYQVAALPRVNYLYHYFCCHN